MLPPLAILHFSFPRAKFLEKLVCAYCQICISSHSILKSFYFHVLSYLSNNLIKAISVIYC